MPVTIVSDTSCLMLLDKIGELYLLQNLFGEVITTQTVADEFGNALPDWISIQILLTERISLYLKQLLIKVRQVQLL